MDKRHQSRKEVPNLVVEISDGNNLFSGIVRNISYSGLIIDDVPREINSREEILNITVFSNGKSYRLRAILRWVFENDNKKTIGLRICNVPRDWFGFVDGS